MEGEKTKDTKTIPGAVLEHKFIEKINLPLDKHPDIFNSLTGSEVQDIDLSISVSFVFLLRGSSDFLNQVNSKSCLSEIRQLLLRFMKATLMSAGIKCPFCRWFLLKKRSVKALGKGGGTLGSKDGAEGASDAVWKRELELGIDELLDVWTTHLRSLQLCNPDDVN